MCSRRDESYWSQGAPCWRVSVATYIPTYIDLLQSHKLKSATTNNGASMTPPFNSSKSTSTDIRNPFATAPPLEHRPFSDPNRLAPEDAFAHSPPRQQCDRMGNGSIDGSIANGDLAVARAGGVPRVKREKERGRSGSRKNKLGWKKLLWVKHPGCMTF